MNARSMIRGCAVAALLSLCALPLPAAGDAPVPATQAGDSWDMTSQMSMEGMPMVMPAQTQRTCTPKEWTQPPGGAREAGECQTSDFKRAGTKTTWKLQCAGPPAMTGQGEITRSSPDAYSGFVKFSSPDGVMTVKLSGRRVGACRIAQ